MLKNEHEKEQLKSQRVLEKQIETQNQIAQQRIKDHAWLKASSRSYQEGGAWAKKGSFLR